MQRSVPAIAAFESAGKDFRVSSYVYHPLQLYVRRCTVEAYTGRSDTVPTEKDVFCDLSALACMTASPEP